MKLQTLVGQIYENDSEDFKIDFFDKVDKEIYSIYFLGYYNGNYSVFVEKDSLKTLVDCKPLKEGNREKCLDYITEYLVARKDGIELRKFFETY